MQNFSAFLLHRRGILNKIYVIFLLLSESTFLIFYIQGGSLVRPRSISPVPLNIADKIWKFKNMQGVLFKKWNFFTVLVFWSTLYGQK